MDKHIAVHVRRIPVSPSNIDILISHFPLNKRQNFMDPLADKLLVCAAMICLVEMGKLAAWIVIVIMSREFIISGFRHTADCQFIWQIHDTTSPIKSYSYAPVILTLTNSGMDCNCYYEQGIYYQRFSACGFR